MTACQTMELNTGWGSFLLAGDDMHLYWVGLPGEGQMPALQRFAGRNGLTLSPGGSPLLTRTARELEEYLDGRRQHFTIPLHLRGTPFQRAVWQALLAIPWGQTRAYSEIAAAVGRPRGARAVGMAVHNNPVAVIVPCHRVIGRDGSLVGFGGGLPLKERLLRLEGVLQP